MSSLRKSGWGGGRDAATLLSTKVAVCMLVHSKEKIESIYTCAPLTKAGKLEDQNAIESQKLTSSLNHGW